MSSLLLAMSTATEECLGRHGGPDPLLVDALAELDQRRGVQPEVRDVPADRLVDDRLGGRPERGPLAADDEPLQLRLEVELRIRLDQVVDQPDGQLAGGEPDRLVVVGVDHVVAAALALDLPGLAAAHVVADRLLQLQGHVLGDVADPGALVQPLDEPAAPAAAAAVVCSPGSRSTSASAKPGSLLVGKSSNTPRSTTSWMAGS